ncbi:unnamed protein product [Oncorhynchus mykiss]|uniref:CCHC-type domain-containing protein n=1 Tax=Oncorhynchus mykiss TaxID=8022 RepID=A0A060XGT1_ONCMY|nr:unnamed protein product [Oncorhynchus mykiss]
MDCQQHRTRIRYPFQRGIRSLFLRSPIGDLLIELHQGRNSAAKHALEVRTVAAGSGWNEAALLTVYRRGLNRELQAELACRGEPSGFKSIHWYVHLHRPPHRRRTLPPRNQKPSLSMILSSRPCLPEPRQLGHAPQPVYRTSKRIQEGLCLYCGGKDHLLSRCPVLLPRRDEKGPTAAMQVSVSLLLSIAEATLRPSIDNREGGYQVRRRLDRFRSSMSFYRSPASTRA